MPAQNALLMDNHADAALGKANVQALSKLQETLKTMCDDTYTKAPSAGFSPIGGHVRHIIEFYQEFFTAEKAGFSKGLSYDNRQRNILYETSCTAALEEIKSLIILCENSKLSHEPIPLSMTIDPDNAPLCDMITTPTRELFHLLDHAMHHMALIKITAAQLGSECDENFGMAKSTLVHNQTKDATAASLQMEREPLVALERK